jgi:hypothetical protein
MSLQHCDTLDTRNLYSKYPHVYPQKSPASAERWRTSANAKLA